MAKKMYETDHLTKVQVDEILECATNNNILILLKLLVKYEDDNS